METPLWKHQVDAIERAKDVNEFALFMEPGTGKTRTMLEILRLHYNSKQKITKTLIVAPLIVVKNWSVEIAQYTKIQKEKVHFLDGTISNKAREIQEKDGIVIVNYDVFIKEEFAKAVIKWNPDILILDESHRCKDPKSKRTKNLLKISRAMHPTSRRFLLTGSPITNTQMDLWSQFYILDRGATFGESYFGFRNAYFINVNALKPKDGRYYPLWVAKQGIDEILNTKIKHKSAIVKKSECLDLPPLIRQEIEVPLSPQQKKLYQEMKRDFITFVNDKAAAASIALTKILRMQQILSGFLKMEDGTIERLDNPRARILGELLGDICGSSKTIVWSVFHEDYATIRDICEQLGIGYAEAHGLVQHSEKEINIERFKTEDSCRVLIGSPAAIGIGINLVQAQCSIWYSRNFSLEQDEQATARNYRGGSEIHSSITRYDLVVPSSLDALILTALRDKKSIVENVLRIDLESL